MATSDSSDSNKTCVVCCHDTNIWAVGECNHPTCLLCSARLRVLCKQNECPVCRLDLKQVDAQAGGENAVGSPPLVFHTIGFCGPQVETV